MPEFFALSDTDRQEALAVAADKSGRPTHLLEKDVWVVWTLQELFASKYGAHIVFKGGTSLSKAYGIIRRFSEDVDLTYDIRVIADDLVKKADSVLPPSRSQANKWSSEIRDRLAKLVSAEIAPLLHNLLKTKGLPATISVEKHKIFVKYKELVGGYSYVKPIVTLEFGARSTGEPHEVREIVCDAAAHLPTVEFPTAKPHVMRPERTFWEKATAIHVFCHQGEFRGGDRFARHWHDLVRLDTEGYADAAIADKSLANDVAKHKALFFEEKDKAGNLIDYHQAVSGSLLLIATDDALAVLTNDYKGMVDDGLLLDEAESFEHLMARCKAIQDKANKTSAPALSIP